MLPGGGYLNETALPFIPKPPKKKAKLKLLNQVGGYEADREAREAVRGRILPLQPLALSPC